MTWIEQSYLYGNRKQLDSILKVLKENDPSHYNEILNDAVNTQNDLNLCK